LRRLPSLALLTPESLLRLGLSPQTKTQAERVEELVRTLEVCLAEAQSREENLPKRPTRAFFAEWDDPLISRIGWVSELVEIAGDVDIFADRRHQRAAEDRIVTGEEVVEREPDLIIGS
jgi:iron complex transport system substrate-binding protein